MIVRPSRVINFDWRIHCQYIGEKISQCMHNAYTYIYIQ